MSKKIKKLYRVEFRDMDAAYVLAYTAEEAYRKCRKDFDDRDYGFHSGRVMKSVTLVAEDSEFPECEVRLFS